MSDRETAALGAERRQERGRVRGWEVCACGGVSGEGPSRMGKSAHEASDDTCVSERLEDGEPTSSAEDRGPRRGGSRVWDTFLLRLLLGNPDMPTWSSGKGLGGVSFESRQAVGAAGLGKVSRGEDPGRRRQTQHCARSNSTTQTPGRWGAAQPPQQHRGRAGDTGGQGPTRTSCCGSSRAAPSNRRLKTFTGTAW